MRDIKGSTSEEIRMIKAIQRSVGALENGWIGNQTLSDIAAKLGADCFPLNVELYGQPCIIARDIEPVNMSGPLPKNSISGSFSWQGQPCSILVRGGKIVRAFVPLSEMFGYSTDLRSKTQGRGNYSMFFEKYEPVPKSVQDKVISEHKR